MRAWSWFLRLFKRRTRFPFQPRLEQVLTAGLPPGPRDALFLLEKALTDGEQPLTFTPEELLSALGVRVAWLARELDSEGAGIPRSLTEPQLERLEQQAGEGLGRLAPFCQDRYQMLFLLGLMVVELVDSTQAEE